MKVKKPQMLVRKDKKTGRIIGRISKDDFLKYANEIIKVSKGRG